MPDMTNMFLLIVLLICIANNLHVTNGQGNTKKDCQAGANADSCLMKLLMIGDPDYKFPENMASMDKQCRTYKNQEKCIKDYAAKCLATFPKQVTNVLAYGASKTNKAYCSTKRRKDSFIAIGKCGNKLKFLVDKCMRQFIDSLQGIENYQDAKMKIPISCCNYYKLKECILGHIERQGPPLCTETTSREVESLVDGYANEVLNLICGDYTEDSDKCTKLILKTPKKLPSQKPPKSILPPFINILSSVPQ